ncbi:hypothetical protein CEXT_277271 [Caerostris extrusa]|uniref:Uncharacterized protein n=1 Tax=Caerostris extrusa TaxID=172846 RepID=A0AAV4Y4U6_CAEEX|nr:hypothetical protein CEXT_277271 [Caerostris extrusa]
MCKSLGAVFGLERILYLRSKVSLWDFSSPIIPQLILFLFLLHLPLVQMFRSYGPVRSLGGVFGLERISYVRAKVKIPFQQSAKHKVHLHIVPHPFIPISAALNHNPGIGTSVSQLLTRKQDQKILFRSFKLLLRSPGT